MMRRREFITLLSGAAAAWPLAARAQQAAKLPIVGFLGTDASGWRPWTSAFVQRLHELGWIEGRTIAIEYRWSEGRPERHAEIAAEFVRLKVDVIVSNAIAVPTLMQATAVIPIVIIRCSAVRGMIAFVRATSCAGCSRAWWRHASRLGLLVAKRSRLMRA